MSQICFRWLGVAGIEITCDSETLLIDPFFTRPPLHRLWIGRVEPDRALIAASIQRCDLILVSHAHYDHLLDVPEIARLSGARVLGSANTCTVLKAHGIPEAQIHLVRAGDIMQQNSFCVEALAAQHAPIPGFGVGRLPPNLEPPLRLRDYVMDACFSFRVSLPGLRLLVWNDVKQAQAPQADLLFVKPSQGRGYLQTLLRSTRAKLVVPVHWDNFFQSINQPPQPFFEPPQPSFPPLRRVNLQRFKAMVARYAPQTTPLIPEMLKTYPLDSIVKSDEVESAC